MLQIANLNLYYGAAQILRNVSFTAQPGRVFCVLGRNGVGKTSLIKAIAGQQAVRTGSIRFDGKELNGLRPYQRARSGVAIAPQGREIFPLLSVKENLETGFAALPRNERYIPEEVFELFPVLAEMQGRRGGDLSGGQQQQLAIGRALTIRPRLLLLDEPTEGVQPSIIKDIARAILYLRNKGDMTIILVEQYFDFARELADDFLVLDRGTVVLLGDRASMVEDDVRRHMSV